MCVCLVSANPLETHALWAANHSCVYSRSYIYSVGLSIYAIYTYWMIRIYTPLYYYTLSVTSRATIMMVLEYMYIRKWVVSEVAMPKPHIDTQQSAFDTYRLLLRPHIEVNRTRANIYRNRRCKGVCKLHGGLA